MSRLDIGSIISTVWCVTAFFSKLDKLGYGSMSMRQFLYHGYSHLNYMSRMVGEIEQFVDALIGEHSELAVGVGAVFVNKHVFPSYILWCESSEEAGVEPTIASSIVARSLDMCCVFCGSEFSGIDRGSLLPVTLTKLVLSDSNTISYKGVPGNVWSVCNEIHKQINSSLLCGLFPSVVPKTVIMLSVQPDNPDEVFSGQMVDSAPIVQNVTASCAAFSTRKSIDSFLRATGQVSDTVLARIPKGGGLSGNLLRIEKGGRFTGAHVGEKTNES